MNVLQRVGAGTALGAAVPVLDLDGVATEAAASRMRREFRRWTGRITDGDTADDMTLAVYEALANVVDHAYVRAERPGPMRLWAAVSLPLHNGRDLVVTVSDRGVWRYGTERGFRGRGLPLVRTLAGSASVLLGPGGTTVQMRKRVPPA